MFRFTVFLVHVFLFLLATVIGVYGKYNPSARVSDKSYGVWFSAIVIFNVLVIVSAFVQLRVRKIWLFLIAVIGLIFFLIYFLPQIVLYLESLF